LASLPLALLLFVGPGSGVTDITSLSVPLLVTLVLAGPITAVPLYLFAKGTKLLPLGTVGFLQFASPTLQFLCGVFVFHDPFPLRNLVPFSLIWVAAILYIVSASTRPRRG
jgi:chloramphenicol-sensitive protein RarD